MIHPRFFYSVSKASLAVVLSFTPLVGYAQPPLDLTGALSAALITTPAPEVAALTVRGFESIPDALLAYLCTYFSEDERCTRTRQISKSFDKAVTETLRLQYPLEEMIHAIPSFLRDRATTLKIVNHAMAPLRAIQLIEDYQGVSRSTDGFEQKFPDKPEKKILIRRLKHLAIQLYKESDSQQFILELMNWIDRGATRKTREKLEHLIHEFQNQIYLSEMPLTYDLLAFCQLRGIGMQKEADFEKNSSIQSLQMFKKESKLSQKMLPLIRSLRLNDYLTLKAQLWPLVTKVKSVQQPKVDLPPLTEVELKNFQALEKTNLLNARESLDCGRFFANQKDFTRALTFCQYSAGLGYSSAQHQAGYSYLHGQGTQANEDIALYYYRLAAAQNSATSHWNMGVHFKNHRHLANHDLALHHFSKAAELYHAEKKQSDYLDALVDMAWLHLWGRLTSPDPSLAITYLHQAEEGKNTDAYLYLADCYQSGRSVEKSLETAFKYLDKATAEGTPAEKATAEQRRKRWIKEREKK